MNCRDCGGSLNAANTYASGKQVFTLCRPCWNRRCVARRHGNADYWQKHQVAKRRWDAANPERKRVIEGRSIFLGHVHAPSALLELERVVMKLGMRRPP